MSEEDYHAMERSIFGHEVVREADMAISNSQKRGGDFMTPVRERDSRDMKNLKTSGDANEIWQIESMMKRLLHDQKEEINS
eukprot:10629664-Karenia_brevis.AAC.1